jgi:polar amino acid transport system substrate-binding protein
MRSDAPMRQLVVLFSIAAACVTAAQAAPVSALPVSYIEKPPYYYTDGAQAKGFLLLRAQQIFERAAIVVTLVSRPARRALHEVESNAGPTCSIGWFKSAEREAFAKFSVPIHQDRPMAVLTELGREAAVRKYPTLRALMAAPLFHVGVVDGFSYGPYITN